MPAPTSSPALSELIAVLKVAQNRSFRKAAAELGLSTSALSHAVSKLEKSLGVRLFHRTTRSVAPTEAGEQFLSKIAPAVAAIGAAVDDIDSQRTTPSGTIRLNMSAAAAHILLGPILLPYLARYPNVVFDVVTEGKLVDIVAQGFDAGVRAAASVPRDMIAIDCTPPLRWVAVASVAYLTQYNVPSGPEDLKSHACISTRLPGGGLYSWEFNRGEDTVSIIPNGPLLFDNYTLMIAAACAGVGIAWVNCESVASELADGRLVEILVDWSLKEPPLQLYYPSSRQLPAAMRALICLIREVYPKTWLSAGSADVS
ncbi:MAG: LysR family transcriptional regulator [Sphingomonadaceae bacterium]